MLAIRHRIQDDDTAETALPCIDLTDSTAAACLRDVSVAGYARPVVDHIHQRAVQKLRGLCDELITKTELCEAIELPRRDAREFRDQAEAILRAAGCAYAKAIAKAKIAKAQAEMMARVVAEQQAVAEKRAADRLDDGGQTAAAAEGGRARPLHGVARRAADVILFRKRTDGRVPLAA
jgi:hypothetical protein